jgi:hypothetical protein
MAVYSGDLDSGSFLTMDFGCSVTSYASPINSSSGIVRYDCRGWKGSSGGPVMIAGTDRVIALNLFGGLQWHASGREKTCTEKLECIRGGPDLSKIYPALRSLRQEIIAGKPFDSVRRSTRLRCMARTRTPARTSTAKSATRASRSPRWTT